MTSSSIATATDILKMKIMDGDNTLFNKPDFRTLECCNKIEKL